MAPCQSMKPGFVNILTQTQSILLPSQHLWSLTGDAGVTGSAPTDLFTPGVYGFVSSGGTATLTDSDGITENMSAGTSSFGYASNTIGATGLLLDTSKTSVNTNVYMGRSIMQTLSKYIDDVLMLNGDIDQKIYNLEEDVDSLVDDQEASGSANRKSTSYIC